MAVCQMQSIVSDPKMLKHPCDFLKTWLGLLPQEVGWRTFINCNFKEIFKGTLKRKWWSAQIPVKINFPMYIIAYKIFYESYYADLTITEHEKQGKTQEKNIVNKCS